VWRESLAGASEKDACLFGLLSDRRRGPDRGAACVSPYFESKGAQCRRASLGQPDTASLYIPPPPPKSVEPGCDCNRAPDVAPPQRLKPAKSTKALASRIEDAAEPLGSGCRDHMLIARLSTASRRFLTARSASGTRGRCGQCPPTARFSIADRSLRDHVPASPPTCAREHAVGLRIGQNLHKAVGWGDLGAPLAVKVTADRVAMPASFSSSRSFRPSDLRGSVDHVRDHAVVHVPGLPAIISAARRPRPPALCASIGPAITSPMA